MYIEPFDDDELIYDHEAGEYYLTEYALERAGIGLREEVATNKGVNVDIVINNWIKRVCMHVYSYIYDHNYCQRAQKWVIAHDDVARSVIKEALLNQAYYVRALGDLSLSVKNEERMRVMDDITISILDKTIPSVGHALTYTGRWEMPIIVRGA